jgi:hypothetical protein
VKVIEKVSSKETIFNLMPSSDNFDYQAFVTKIKNLKMQPFHDVYIFTPNEMCFAILKELKNKNIDIKQMEIKHGLAKFEVA